VLAERARLVAAVHDTTGHRTRVGVFAVEHGLAS
jgi:hypothetical protein